MDGGYEGGAAGGLGQGSAEDGEVGRAEGCSGRLSCHNFTANSRRDFDPAACSSRAATVSFACSSLMRSRSSWSIRSRTMTASLGIGPAGT
jgi:hypothetical protein